MREYTPLVDAIDVRNYHDSMKKSVIKRSRVHFITEEDENINVEATGELLSDAVNDEPEIDTSNIDPDVLAQADEIFKRLQAEAAADDAAKTAEWTEKIAMENGNLSASDYNATTGSYSGAYGKDASAEAIDAAASILDAYNNIDDMIKLANGEG